MKSEVIVEEIRKYLKVYVLSENQYNKREFALELLLKLESFGATQSQDAIPSVGSAQYPSLDK
jgi:hypothetical protein